MDHIVLVVRLKKKELQGSSKHCLYFSAGNMKVTMAENGCTSHQIFVLFVSFPVTVASAEQSDFI